MFFESECIGEHALMKARQAGHRQLSQCMPTHALQSQNSNPCLNMYNYTMTPHILCSNLPQIHLNHAMYIFQFLSYAMYRFQ